MIINNERKKELKKRDCWHLLLHAPRIANPKQGKTPLTLTFPPIFLANRIVNLCQNQQLSSSPPFHQLYTPSTIHCLLHTSLLSHCQSCSPLSPGESPSTMDQASPLLHAILPRASVSQIHMTSILQSIPDSLLTHNSRQDPHLIARRMLPPFLNCLPPSYRSCLSPSSTPRYSSVCDPGSSATTRPEAMLAHFVHSKP